MSEYTALPRLEASPSLENDKPFGNGFGQLGMTVASQQLDRIGRHVCGVDSRLCHRRNIAQSRRCEKVVVAGH